MVLLVAPAGYGKTIALARALEGLEGEESCSAWVTLDDGDDLQRLVAYLIDALEPFDPPWRMAPEVLVERAAGSALPEVASILLAAIEAIGLTHGVIALDDVHAVADHRVFELTQLMLDGLPERWTRRRKRSLKTSRPSARGPRRRALGALVLNRRCSRRRRLACRSQRR